MTQGLTQPIFSLGKVLCSFLVFAMTVIGVLVGPDASAETNLVPDKNALDISSIRNATSGNQAGSYTGSASSAGSTNFPDPLFGQTVTARFLPQPLGFNSDIWVEIQPAAIPTPDEAKVGNDDPGSIWRKWIRLPRSPAQDSLTLYVNGIELPGSFQNEVRSVATGDKSGLPAESYLFHFKLTRNKSDSTNVKAWKKLLGTFDQWGNGEASLPILR
jgi:hypothetical protein